jgi:endonuclease YncB( thermonuclease family)
LAIVLWWRRNEGFEWKEYVRTTVLVRRQIRREKMEAARNAAAESVKGAGRKGVEIGAAGAEAAGQAAVQLAKSAASGAIQGAGRGVGLLAGGGRAARSRIAAASQPLNARLARPGLGHVLLAIAVLSGSALAVRAWQFGLDADAAVLTVVATLTGLLWVWPRIFAGPSPEEKEDEEGEALVSLAAPNSRSAPGVISEPRAQAAMLVTIAAVAAGVFLWLAAPSLLGLMTSSTVAPEPKRAKEGVIEGSASVVGAGLLEIGDQRVRLATITPLDPGQMCSMAGGATFACGSAARVALDKLVRGRRAVTCEVSSVADGIATAICTKDGKDIAAQLVRAGHAFADGLIWSPYASEQAAAREDGAGLWAGEPEQPGAWRARIWEAAAATAPGGCPVKGRIQSGKKFYVMPHAADYGRIAIREARGEQWFCSAQEAEAQGFRARDAR